MQNLKLQCVVCGESKMISHFRKCRRLPDERLPWCRHCDNLHYVESYKDKVNVMNRLFDDVVKQVELQAVGKTVMQFNKTYFSMWLYINPTFKSTYQTYLDDTTLTKDYRVNVISRTSMFSLRNLSLELVDLEVPFEVKILRDYSSKYKF